VIAVTTGVYPLDQEARKKFPRMESADDVRGSLDSTALLDHSEGSTGFRYV
jgi:hypothetical protein